MKSFKIVKSILRIRDYIETCWLITSTINLFQYQDFQFVFSYMSS